VLPCYWDSREHLLESNARAEVRTGVFGAVTLRRNSETHLRLIFRAAEKRLKTYPFRNRIEVGFILFFRRCSISSSQKATMEFDVVAIRKPTAYVLADDADLSLNLGCCRTCVWNKDTSGGPP
jgi:hypothetical protein